MSSCRWVRSDDHDMHILLAVVLWIGNDSCTTKQPSGRWIWIRLLDCMDYSQVYERRQNPRNGDAWICSSGLIKRINYGFACGDHHPRLVYLIIAWLCLTPRVGAHTEWWSWKGTWLNNWNDHNHVLFLSLFIIKIIMCNVNFFNYREIWVKMNET